MICGDDFIWVNQNRQPDKWLVKLYEEDLRKIPMIVGRNELVNSWKIDGLLTNRYYGPK